MKTIILSAVRVASFLLLMGGMGHTASAADVEARLSTRETYVGIPVVMQLSVQNAADFEPPTIPDIDGCDIRSAGAPSRSSRTTIINGRRSESHSVTMQYLLTPRREGTFEIPPVTVNVAGRDVQTRPLRFVATRSETGNLLFVEVEGGENQVYVGEPLELTLKIWLKPFRDAEKDITLSEANMWQLISEQTSWGSFADRMKELAENNQRPGGREVLRDDGQGRERSYYLYEILATVYPKRPGRIDASDVQIVVNYPTELGRSRDPFEGFFGDSPFGGRSPLSQMFDDEFFSSPFGNRLTVSSTRPIVAEAEVDATEVVPVPTEGRPADYRGAVGQYEIVTQASPTAVEAGNPITLNIGISGTGPMQLVQAPPLAEVPSLTDDFKVADQSLAGFVQDNTKLFSTTIRPRREGITQIPAIPFSYFDPDSGAYRTVVSEPIAITVDKSESLSLDAIVGSRHSADRSAGATRPGAPQPDFTNDHTARVLIQQFPAATRPWWWFFVIMPPIVWLTTLVTRHRSRIGRHLPGLRPARQRCLSEIDRATDRSAVAEALVRYIERRTGKSCPSGRHALGALRTSGLAQTANDVEDFFRHCEHTDFSGDGSGSLDDSQQTARQLVASIEDRFASTTRSRVRGGKRTSGGRAKTLRSVRRTARSATTLLIAAWLTVATSAAIANEHTSSETAAISGSRIELSDVQRQTILAEAGQLYSRAARLQDTDSLEAKDLFESSAEDYQLLVDSGVRNSLLYRNLGNAYLQSGQIGRAIANYERAKQLDPTDARLAANLKFANSLVNDQQRTASVSAEPANSEATSLTAIVQRIRTLNDTLLNFAGINAVSALLAISSFAFWGIHIARAAGYDFAAWRLAIVPLVVLVISLTSVVLATTQAETTDSGVIVVDSVTLHAGDGANFEAVQSLVDAQGHRVQILATRGNWIQIETRHGQTGWLPQKAVESINRS